MNRQREFGISLFAASLILIAFCSARAADDKVKAGSTFTGSWKLSMAMAGGQRGPGAARPADAASRRTGSGTSGARGARGRGLTSQILLNLSQKDGKIDGDFVGFTGKPTAIKDVKLKDGELSFKVPQTMGPATFTITFVAKASGDKMQGTAKIATPSGVREFAFQGDRLKAAAVTMAGNWKLKITLKEGPTFEPILKMTEIGKKLNGVYAGEHGETTISNAAIFGDEVTFDVARDRDGKNYRLHFHGKVKRDALNGTVDYDFDGMTGYVGFTGERLTGSQASADKVH